MIHEYVIAHKQLMSSRKTACNVLNGPLCCVVLWCRSERLGQLRLASVSGVCSWIRVHLCSNPSPTGSRVWITNQPAVCYAGVYTHRTPRQPHSAGPSQVSKHAHTHTHKLKPHTTPTLAVYVCVPV